VAVAVAVAVVAAAAAVAEAARHQEAVAARHPLDEVEAEEIRGVEERGSH